MSEKKVHRVFVFFEVISDKSTEDTHERVQKLLDHGGVSECFSDANLDASHFVVEKVEE